MNNEKTLTDKQITTHSRFLSLVLRHRPDKIGITLDENGWVAVDDLLEACGRHGHRMTREVLDRVVAENNKKRFSYSDDGKMIRASQGHSVNIDLGYEPVEPPEFLYHGTVDRYTDSIKANGLIKRQRHHVHLSKDLETAANVGSRRGKPVILTILAGKMHQDGHKFYISENGVWLTDTVPPEYIKIL